MADSQPNPMRTTRHREAILALLDDAGTFQTAQAIHAALNRDGSPVGLATVYRNLAALAQSGAVDCIATESGESRYRSCSAEHHHHLLCRACGKTVEIQASAFESWCQRTATAHGFRDVDHVAELVGTCSDCR